MYKTLLKTSLTAIAVLLLIPSAQADELPDLTLLQQQVTVSSNLAPISATTAAINYHASSEIPLDIYFMYNVIAGQQLHVLLEGSYFQDSTAGPYNFNCSNNRAVGTTLFGNNESDNPSCENRAFTNSRSLTFDSIPNRINNRVVDFKYAGLNNTNLKLHIVLLVGTPDTADIPTINPASSSTLTETEIEIETTPTGEEESTTITTPVIDEKAARRQALRERRNGNGAGALERIKQLRMKLQEKRKALKNRILEARKNKTGNVNKTKNKVEDARENIQERRETMNNDTTSPKSRLEQLKERRQQRAADLQDKEQQATELQELRNTANRTWGQINIAIGGHKSQGSLTKDQEKLKKEADKIKAKVQKATKTDRDSYIKRLLEIKDLIIQVKGL